MERLIDKLKDYKPSLELKEQKLITLEEKRVKYCLKFENGISSIVFQVDGGVIYEYIKRK